MLLKQTLALLAVILVGSFVQGGVQQKCVEKSKESGYEIQVMCSHVLSMHEVFNIVELQPIWKNITSLTFTKSNFTFLSLDDLVQLPFLHTLVFNQSQVSNWTVPKATSTPNVTTLILENCWNNYNFLSPVRDPSLLLTNNTFDGLMSLQHFYIDNCYVSLMSSDLFRNLTTFKQLHISNHSGIGCESEMSWLLTWIYERKAIVSNDTECFIARDIGKGGGGILVMDIQYSLSEQPFQLIMEHRKETQKYCPKECRCVVEGYNTNRRKGPIINIYCSDSGLTTLPDIPPYSSRLNFANNSITDINKMFKDENYGRTTSIRLEHNQISSLDGDLFIKFLSGRPHDLFINLSYNNFTTLPVKQMLRLYKDSGGSYAGSNSFKPLIRLEYNSWDCSDCNFLPEFQELVYYQYYHREKGRTMYNNIRCAEGNDFFAGQMVLMLDVRGMCVPDPPLLEPIDMLNICLGFLIILFIANFAYNFYQYRQNGHLPWVVTRVPCC